MSAADELRAEINMGIDLAERVQGLALDYESAIRQLQTHILLLDLNESNNSHLRSIARMSPLLTEGSLNEDKEITGQIKTELQNWLPRV
jgi:hypothetical protein